MVTATLSAIEDLELIAVNMDGVPPASAAVDEPPNFGRTDLDLGIDTRGPWVAHGRRISGVEGLAVDQPLATVPALKLPIASGQPVRFRINDASAG